jgi:hypothetical protein
MDMLTAGAAGGGTAGLGKGATVTGGAGGGALGGMVHPASKVNTPTRWQKWRSALDFDIHFSCAPACGFAIASTMLFFRACTSPTLRHCGVCLGNMLRAMVCKGIWI